MEVESPPPVHREASAWQPFTFRGVAALAGATIGRLMLIGLLVAMAMAGAVTQALYATWVPVIDSAIHALPADGEIQHGKLVWPTNAPVALADNSFLAIGARPAGSENVPPAADVAIELGPSGWIVSSILGSVEIPYPRRVGISLGRTDLSARWWAWRPHLIGAVFVVVTAVVLLMWVLVGLIVAPFVRAYVGIWRRRASLATCARLAIAACMPGEIVMAVGVIMYGLRRISLAELLAVTALHVVVVATYMLVAPLWLPAEQHPFLAPREDAPVTKPRNPFAAPPRESDDR